MVNWGSGFITIINYSAGADIIMQENVILTENNLDILTESSQELLTET